MEQVDAKMYLAKFAFVRKDLLFITFSLQIWLVSSAMDTSNNTNSMMGMPEVVCTQDGVAFTMETERPFHGQLYVKDEYQNPKCRVNFKGLHKPGAAFHLTFNECGMRRQRNLNPRGLVYSLTMMVQFHEVFVTEGDRAFQIRCFYSEQHTNLTSSIEVSPLTTQLMEATFPTPTCTYTIRSKAMDGPFASVVKVGDPLIHVFACNFVLDMYRILIKDCFVDDGKNQKQRIIGSDGCSVDDSIMQTPQYRSGKLEAFGESTAFKWPDESAVYFSCQIVLCMNEGHACDDITPPKCEDKRRTKRSLNSKNKSDMEFDLEVKKLTVVENDSLRARTAMRQSFNHSGNNYTNFSKNSSLYDDYLAILHRNSTTTTKTLGADEPVEWSTFRPRHWSKFDRLTQACFGFETVAAFCVLFTLFVATLTVITCKLCLPCCSDGENFHSNDREASSFYDRRRFCGCCGGRGDSLDETDFEESIVDAYRRPVYAPTSLSAKQLLFSKFNLEM